MALVSVPGGLWLPHMFFGGYSTTMLLDATAEKAAQVFMVPKSGNLRAFEFRLGTVTQAPANGLKCSFQDVDTTTGDPDGTADQSVTVTTGLTSNTWVNPGNFSADRAVTRGALLSAVIEFASFLASDSLNISRGTTPAGTEPLMFPYSDLFTASWAKSGNQMIMALRYDDGSSAFVAPQVQPWASTVSTSYNSGSTPDERALFFQLPHPCKVGGVKLYVGTNATGRDFDLVLYDSDGTTALGTISVDANVLTGTSALPCFFYFSSDITLAANTNYRLSVKPTTASNITLLEATVNAAGFLDGVEGGQNWHLSTRTDAGAWSQTTTTRPQIGLLITAVDDGVKAGGISRSRSQAII